jgi:hypothetical protein
MLHSCTEVRTFKCIAYFASLSDLGIRLFREEIFRCWCNRSTLTTLYGWKSFSFKISSSRPSRENRVIECGLMAHVIPAYCYSHYPEKITHYHAVNEIKELSWFFGAQYLLDSCVIIERFQEFENHVRHVCPCTRNRPQSSWTISIKLWYAPIFFRGIDFNLFWIILSATSCESSN